MCSTPKQIVNAAAGLAAVAFTIATPEAMAGPASAGGAALGDSNGGVTDRAYVTAPPHWAFIVEKEPGSFLDCGDGMETHITDEAGRDLASLHCGVTLTETLVIPAAAASARIIVHY
jgi:hypothetical protein